MTTIIAIFLIALLISFFGTPLAAKLGFFIGAVDHPNARKVHKKIISRCGGISIFVSFICALLLSKQLINTNIIDQIIWDTKFIAFIGGGTLIFIVGLLDDIYRLNAKIKLIFQIVCASIAFYGGLRIVSIHTITFTYQTLIISYFITVFWFVLLINAINLIDGLDGLAGGIVFLTSIILVFLLAWQKNYLHAVMFAALAGAVFGFLRYNFNPASIYMGDGGSYFLGYSIAGLSILGSAKMQMSAAILIPLLALGVPVFDTILSPIRRFIIGEKLFQPDKSHIHHKIIEKGFSTRKAVLLIYGISAALCIFALVVIQSQHRHSGYFLIAVAIAALVVTRKLGYFEYFAVDKIGGWLKDITDVTGISHARRSFLSLQIEISHSKTLEEMWANACRALILLNFDWACLNLGNDGVEDGQSVYYTGEERRRADSKIQLINTNTHIWSKSENGGPPSAFYWARGNYRREEDIHRCCLFKIEIPLMNGNDKNYKTLILMKDIKVEHLNRLTLRRVEQLRSTMLKVIDWIERESSTETKLVDPIPAKGIKEKEAKALKILSNKKEIKPSQSKREQPIIP